MKRYLGKIVFCGIVFFIAYLFSFCEKEKAVFFPPELGELKVTDITDISAKASCNVVKTDRIDIIECGFCYYPEGDNSAIHNIKANIQESFSICILGLLPEKEYMVKAYAKNVVGVAYSNILSFKTLHNTDTIPSGNDNDTIPTNIDSGTVNGHDWVDLGLPSGLKWATCNVGASTPTEYGNYYAWGEATTKSSYTESTYTYSYSSNPTTLPSSADAATANWGSGWRMPTYDELNELQNNCTVTWTTQNGVNGRLFTGPNGNSIFLPAAGYRKGSYLYNAGFGFYWSSSLYAGDTRYAWYHVFYPNSYLISYVYRYYGQSVRAVCQSR